MRSWFILFATTFTITSLVLSITTWFIEDMAGFDNKYVLLLAVTNALLSLFMILTNRLQRENFFITMVVDIVVIFLVVFSTAVIIGIHPVNIINVIITSSLVIIIYIIVLLIYLFILTREAEDMNEKIKEWRTKNVDS